MGYTHLEPGQECEIVERMYSCDGNSDISALVQLSTAELDELAQDSMEKEKAIYAEALAIVARWKQQAYETVAYRMWRQVTALCGSAVPSFPSSTNFRGTANCTA